MNAHRHEVGIWASGISDMPRIASCIDCPWTSDAGSRDEALAAGWKHMEDTAKETS